MSMPTTPNTRRVAAALRIARLTILWPQALSASHAAKAVRRRLEIASTRIVRPPPNEGLRSPSGVGTAMTTHHTATFAGKHVNDDGRTVTPLFAGKIHQLPIDRSKPAVSSLPAASRKDHDCAHWRS